MALLKGDFGPVTSGWWAHLTTGMPETWSARDVLYAIDHQPGGRPHPAGRMHNPAGVLRYRLERWKRADGSWLPSPSQARAAAAAARRQEQADRRAEAARASAATTSNWDGAAAAARAAMAAASASAAAAIARATTGRQRPAQHPSRPQPATVTRIRPRAPRPAPQAPAAPIAPVTPIRRDPAIEAADAELQAAVAEALARMAAEAAAAQDGDS